MLALAPQASPQNLASALVQALADLGARCAFGVPGGALVPTLHALAHGPLRCVTARHESGAMFMAAEASLATRRPAVAYTTSGPGLTNALTGALSARDDGAHVVLLSGMTPAALRGRHPIQDTSPLGLGSAALHCAGLFDEAHVVEDPGMLPLLLRRLAAGFARPGGFIAHLALPLDVQGKPAPALPPLPPILRASKFDDAEAMEIAEMLGDRFALWLGHGARGAAVAARAIAEATGAPVLLTPRGKGILPPGHPAILGVAGMGGDAHLPARLQSLGVERLLVLGSRLGEMGTGHLGALIPPGGLVHVDIDPAVPGSAFPEAPTVAVTAEISAFCEAILPHLRRSRLAQRPRWRQALPADGASPVRPPALMGAVQRQALDLGLAVQVDAGNAISWSTRYLEPHHPMQLRVPGPFGSMACATTGAVGRAIATGEPVVAVVGDGAMLMQNELPTAVEQGARVVFVVLNDGALGMVEQGMAALGRAHPACAWRAVDFAAWAEAQGALGLRVVHESALDEALARALAAGGPAVVDVLIDRDVPPPFLERIHRLAAQTGASP